MGVCCIVFDIDGMLFEFFRYLEKQFFLISFHVLCYFQQGSHIVISVFVHYFV